MMGLRGKLNKHLPFRVLSGQLNRHGNNMHTGTFTAWLGMVDTCITRAAFHGTKHFTGYISLSSYLPCISKLYIFLVIKITILLQIKAINT